MSELLMFQEPLHALGFLWCITGQFLPLISCILHNVSYNPYFHHTLPRSSHYSPSQQYFPQKGFIIIVQSLHIFLPHQVWLTKFTAVRVMTIVLFSPPPHTHTHWYAFCHSTIFSEYITHPCLQQFIFSSHLTSIVSSKI